MEISKTTSPGRQRLRWLVDNLDAVVTAFVMALVIKCYCLDVFQIPTGSMYPTLKGDQKEGDRVIATGDKIMVTKFVYPFTSINRYDVMVFRFPLQQSKHFIKRVVGLPDEDIMISNGDIYARKNNTGPFLITRKPIHVQEAIWINTSDYDDMFRDQKVFDEYWFAGEGKEKMRVTDGEWDVQGDGKVQVEYKGDIRSPGSLPVNDLKLSIQVTPLEGDGYLQLALSNTYGAFLFHAVPGGEGLVTYDNGKETIRFPLRPALLKFHRPQQIEFGVFDGTVLLKINGEIELHKPWLTSKLDDLPYPIQSPRVAIVASNLALKAAHLKLVKDIYYEGAERSGYPEEARFYLKTNEVQHIDPGFYFVLGDNVRDSHDSRKWIKYEYMLKDGRSIVCERMAAEPGDEPTKGYDRVVREDIYGTPYYFYNRDLLSQEPKKSAARLIDERFIVGKAFWVWLPSGMKLFNPDTWQFRLIR